MALLAALLLATGAWASGGRALPSGESHPAVVEKMFSSPRGEVQFLAVSGGHSALLRNAGGGLADFKEVRGPSSCDEWLISDKTAALPAGCDFYFHDDVTGGLFSVRSEEMEEASLFQAVKGTMRGAIVAL